MTSGPRAVERLIPARGSGPAAAVKPLVSIIVPARNPGGLMDELIHCLRDQTIPAGHFELIVADDGSTEPWIDDLPAETEFPIKVTPGPPLNSYAARNRAVALAQAPVLAFCDSDCKPVPTWLESGLCALEEAEVIAGLIRFQVPERRTVWTLLDMDAFLDQERAVMAGHAVTANLFVRRVLFDDLGGFDDSLPEYGDYAFVARGVAQGARLVFDREAEVSHPTRDSGKSFLSKAWKMNRFYALRESLAGRRPELVRVRSWVPFVEPFLSRRWYGRSLGLDRRRLSENGVEPRLRDNLRAVPLMYLVMPYLSSAAQLYGWFEGRRARRQGRA